MHKTPSYISSKLVEGPGVAPVARWRWPKETPLSNPDPAGQQSKILNSKVWNDVWNLRSHQMESEAKSDHFANVAQSKSLDCWKVIFTFVQYCTLVAISQNNAAPWNIIFELGTDFGHLLFESYLVIEWTDSNRTKWITWPMSGHNFHVLWTNPVKCAHRPWCHQMYRIFVRGDKS